MGVLVIDKPVGPSSFDVVRRVKRELGRLWGSAALRGLKIGHGGTLDPMASGVLPVCLGEGTKLAPFLLDADKAYEAEIELGVETDTLDATGEVLARHDLEPAGLTADRLREALAAFRGPIQQVPPMYSALKHQGRPLYRYARAGEDIERAPRAVTIHALELLAWQPPSRVSLSIRCSKGTYVRTLAADLGRALGVGGHLTALRRTASGPFSLAQSVTLAGLAALVDGGASLPLVDLASALAHLPALSVPSEVVLALTQGKRLSPAAAGFDEGAAGRFRVLRPDGTLVAVADVVPGAETVETRRVFGHPGAPSAHPVAEPPRQVVKFSATAVDFDAPSVGNCIQSKTLQVQGNRQKRV